MCSLASHVSLSREVCFHPLGSRDLSGFQDEFITSKFVSESITQVSRLFSAFLSLSRLPLQRSSFPVWQQCVLSSVLFLARSCCVELPWKCLLHETLIEKLDGIWRSAWLGRSPRCCSLVAFDSLQRSGVSALPSLPRCICMTSRWTPLCPFFLGGLSFRLFFLLLVANF